MSHTLIMISVEDVLLNPPNWWALLIIPGILLMMLSNKGIEQGVTWKWAVGWVGFVIVEVPVLFVIYANIYKLVDR